VRTTSLVLAVWRLSSSWGTSDKPGSRNESRGGSARSSDLQPLRRRARVPPRPLRGGGGTRLQQTARRRETPGLRAAGRAGQGARPVADDEGVGVPEPGQGVAEAGFQDAAPRALHGAGGREGALRALLRRGGSPGPRGVRDLLLKARFSDATPEAEPSLGGRTSAAVPVGVARPLLLAGDREPRGKSAQAAPRRAVRRRRGGPARRGGADGSGGRRRAAPTARPAGEARVARGLEQPGEEQPPLRCTKPIISLTTRTRGLHRWAPEPGGPRGAPLPHLAFHLPSRRPFL